MTNTSAAASVSFVALSRIAGDHDATGTGSAVRGTGLSLTTPWAGVTAPSAATQAMRNARNAVTHNYIAVPATNVAALAKQGAPPRGEPR